MDYKLQLLLLITIGILCLSSLQKTYSASLILIQDALVFEQILETAFFSFLFTGNCYSCASYRN